MRISSSDTVQVEMNAIRGLNVLVNGVLQELDDTVTETAFAGTMKKQACMLQTMPIFAKSQCLCEPDLILRL